MPPQRKVPKEPIVYPASKKRPPPFKPLRPSSKFPPISTSEPESSANTKIYARPTTANAVRQAGARASRVIDIVSLDGSDNQTPDDGTDQESLANLGANAAGPNKVTTKGKERAAALQRNHSSARHLSPNVVKDGTQSPDQDDGALTTKQILPSPQKDDIPSVPQPLLLRLLHEAFEDKGTKIDKHAMRVVQKYVEVFVREAIERARLEKQEASTGGEASDVESNWLELEDLEKVAPSMILDF